MDSIMGEFTDSFVKGLALVTRAAIRNNPGLQKQVNPATLNLNATRVIDISKISDLNSPIAGYLRTLLSHEESKAELVGGRVQFMASNQDAIEQLIKAFPSELNGDSQLSQAVKNTGFHLYSDEQVDFIKDLPLDSLIITDNAGLQSERFSILMLISSTQGVLYHSLTQLTEAIKAQAIIAQQQ